MARMRLFPRYSRYDLELDFKWLPPTKNGFETPFHLTAALTITLWVNLLPS